MTDMIKIRVNSYLGLFLQEALKVDDSDVQGDESSKQPPTPERCPSPVEVLGEEELAALTGKEQLKVSFFFLLLKCTVFLSIMLHHSIKFRFK